jgi:hypothetical protein
MENYKRWNRGLPLREEPQPTKHELPELPVVPCELKFESLPDQEIRDIGVRVRNVRNKAGVIFCGFDVFVEFENKKSFQGWMNEGEFARLKKKIPEDRIDLLRKATY